MHQLSQELQMIHPLERQSSRGMKPLGESSIFFFLKDMQEKLNYTNIAGFNFYFLLQFWWELQHLLDCTSTSTPNTRLHSSLPLKCGV
ncbi:hypothetical protein S83_043773 [Arachis hypogaea]